MHAQFSTPFLADTNEVVQDWEVMNACPKAFRWCKYWLFCAALFALTSSTATYSYAQAGTTKAACIDAHERVQALRKSAKLIAARDKARSCASESCPGLIRSECLTFVQKVEEDIPSVALSALDGSGATIVDVTVYVDDRLLTKRLDGRSLDLDPGSHSFRFVVPNQSPVTKANVLIRQGKKNQPVDVVFEKVNPKPKNDASPYDPNPSGPAPAPGSGPAGPGEDGSGNVAAWVVGGIGAAAIIAGAVLVGISWGEHGDLADTCKPNCTDDDVSPVQTKMIAGDVLIGVGVGAVAVAAILLVIELDDGDSAAISLPVTANFVPLPGGGVGAIQARF